MNFKVIALLFCCPLSGCGLFLKSPLQEPQFELPSRWDVNNSSVTSSNSINTINSTEWWSSFGDTQLNSLINEALKNNTDLAVAGYNIQQAALHSDLTDTNLTPNVTSSLSSSSGRLLDRKSSSVRTFQSSNSVSYEIDLWGKLARSRDLAWWEYNATIYDRMAIRLSIISGVANAYWTIGQLNSQIANAKIDIVSAEKQVYLSQVIYSSGSSSYIDLALSKTNLYTLNQNLHDLFSQRETQRKYLNILLARMVTIDEIAKFNLNNSNFFNRYPPLPVKVLINRPDVAAAEARVRKSLANYDLTKGSIFPVITLNGSITTSDATLRNILKNPSGLLGLGIDLPFLQLNTVMNNVNTSKSEYESSLMTYKKSWYQALSEVNESFNLQINLNEQYKLSLKQIEAAKRAVSISRLVYRVGKGTLRDLLNDETSLRQVMSNSLILKNQLLQSNMGLFVSTGGSK